MEVASGASTSSSKFCPAEGSLRGLLLSDFSQKLVDSAGRVERFRSKYAKYEQDKAVKKSAKESQD